MKRMLAAMLAALMLAAFLPLSVLPARAAGVTFSVGCSVDYAYAGEEVDFYVSDTAGGSGSYLYSLDIWKDGQLFSRDGWHSQNYREYTFPSPGKYMARGWVRDKGTNVDYDQFSDEITVKANPLKITRVEPLGASSLRITWNKVPEVSSYSVYRSTDMKNWEFIKMAATPFTDTRLKAGTRYFYKIGYNRLVPSGYIYGPESDAAAGVPMAKTRITSLTSPSGRRIRMTWAKAAGASGYQVAMAASRYGSYKTVRIVTGGTTAIFSGVRSGSALFFKVRPYRRIYTTTYWGQYTAPRAVKVK